MKSTLNKVIIFAAGAVIGSLVAWKLTKTKYEKIMIEEEQSLREYYNRRLRSTRILQTLCMTIITIG